MTAAVRDVSQAQYKDTDDGLQEPEQKSVAGLPVKKVQKLNKELTKQNTQLVKSVDTLKKQKEELLTDRQKLKSENKTLERELKRVSSKGEIQRFSKKSSQMSIEGLDMSTTEELAGKVQRLETLLAEKDKKLRRIRERLEKLNLDLPRIYPLADSDTTSSRESSVVQPISELPHNGGLLEFSMDERLLDEENTNSRLQLENTELRNKMAALESNLEQLQLQISQKDVTDSSSKPYARRKSGHFFKRGKAQSKSLVMKSSEDVQKEREAVKEKERQRSKSPDFFTVSDSFQLASESPQNNFTIAGSLPNFVVSGLSPKTAAKRAHGDIQTLQSCLKLAIDEKNSLGEQNKQLERELVAAKEKIAELQTLAEEQKRLPAVTKEVDSLKSSLKIEASKKATLSMQLSELEKSFEKVKSKSSLLEKQLADTTEKKDLEIANLNEKIRKLEKELLESEDVFLASKKQSPAPPTAVTPPVSTSDENKRKRSISAKLPPSPVRQIKQVTTQKATVENRMKKTRKTSQPILSRGSSSSSLSADEHYDSVANTRAMFEQKIGCFQSNADITSPKHSARKVSWTGERRSSYSSASPGSKQDFSHSKSSSFDATPTVQATVQPNKGTSVENKNKGTSVETKSKGTSVENKNKGTSVESKNKGTSVENKDKGTSVESKNKGTSVENKSVQQSSAPLSLSKSSSGDSSKAQQKPVSSTSTSSSAVKTTNMNFHKHLARYNEASKTQTTNPVRKNSTSNSVPKVTKVTVQPSTTHTTSPVTTSPNKNSAEQSLVQTSVSSSLIKGSNQESSSPSASKQVSSTSSKTSTYTRSLSLGSKKEIPIKNPTVSSSSVKRTTVTPVRSSTVAQFSSVKVTDTTPSPSPSAAVTITTTSSSPQLQRLKQQQQQPQSNGKIGIQKTQSVLTVPGSMKKASSLQDIPEQVNSESGSQNSVASTTPVSPVRKSPVAVRVQRRVRSERPKTMYAGRAETTNLVNLISRFQQQDSKVSSGIGKGTSSSETATMNGFSSPQSSHVILRSTVAKTPVSSNSSVITRQSTARTPRPKSYYGDPTAK